MQCNWWMSTSWSTLCTCLVNMLRYVWWLLMLSTLCTCLSNLICTVCYREPIDSRQTVMQYMQFNSPVRQPVIVQYAPVVPETETVIVVAEYSVYWCSLYDWSMVLCYVSGMNSSTDGADICFIFMNVTGLCLSTGVVNVFSTTMDDIQCSWLPSHSCDVWCLFTAVMIVL